MRWLIWLSTLVTIMSLVSVTEAMTEEERSIIAAHERVADSVVLVLVRSVEAEGGVPGTGGL